MGLGIPVLGSDVGGERGGHVLGSFSRGSGLYLTGIGANGDFSADFHPSGLDMNLRSFELVKLSHVTWGLWTWIRICCFVSQ